MNSNMIVVHLWNDSQALQISRDGLDCQTNGPMIYQRPINAFKKKDIQEVFFQVTIELQYANEVDCVPSKSFFGFSYIKGWKNGWKTHGWFSFCQFSFETGKVAHELKGIDRFVKMPKRKGKDIIEDIRLGCSEPQ